MEQTDCSETLVYELQTQANHPEAYKQPSVNQLFDSFLLTPSLSGAPHAPPTTSDSRLSNQGVSETPVITPGLPPYFHLHNSLNIEPIRVIVHWLTYSLLTPWSRVLLSPASLSIKMPPCYRGLCPAHPHIIPSRSPPDDPNPPFHLPPHRQILRELPCALDPRHS
jgi:hypothetical protein